IQTALIITMTFVGLRLLVRQTWIAVAVGMVVVTAAVTGNVPVGQQLWLYVIGQLIAIGIITLAIFRFGLLVTAVLLIGGNLATVTPMLPTPHRGPRCPATCRSPSSSAPPPSVSTPPSRRSESWKAATHSGRAGPFRPGLARRPAGRPLRADLKPESARE